MAGRVRPTGGAALVLVVILRELAEPETPGRAAVLAAAMLRDVARSGVALFVLLLAFTEGRSCSGR